MSQHTFSNEERARGGIASRRTNHLLPNGDVDIRRTLSPTQFEVFIHSCTEFPKEIGIKMNKDEAWVRHYVSKIKMRLGTTHKGIWMKWAIQQGLVTV